MGGGSLLPIVRQADLWVGLSFFVGYVVLCPLGWARCLLVAEGGGLVAEGACSGGDLFGRGLVAKGALVAVRLFAADGFKSPAVQDGAADIFSLAIGSPLIP